ncbi:MAG: symporter [Bacteroidetes bacterium GWF2_43_63]|nr:MAG: symporter [Bacteroidetes bacterium GWE2_42_42]OFY54660.1 MAG: symporter [Bacteroidetes bacterium GWF2_43_63]HBG71832.1 MFS transporter [Bacteroidales bacterium]HCB61415.1 MFS transporter [Bacteroidales bacterium]HCY23350.1 MFS transporter [Bacteroidales bacterium]
MFKNHPKGLLAAALANMGERFGFYTMMAILVLFLQAKFGLSGPNAGIIYSIFYFSIYILAFVGGLIADKTKNFKGTILVGLILMAIGYFLIAIPTETPVPQGSFVTLLAMTCFGLFVIAFGNGLFKGNLQALVGQMYDNEQYGKMRDSGFSLFYMFINVGAIFAPLAAVGVRNWWVSSHGFAYNSDLPGLCHSHLDQTISADGATKLVDLASKAGFTGTDMTTFANEYLNVFATGFHYAFAVAIGAMLISLVIYLTNKKKFPNPKTKQEIAAGVQAGEMDIKEVKQRLYALFAVFAVVIFFWFSFHQNGLTLTYFAKDYTDLSQININLGFTNLVGAELFQSINPFFVVFLTPVILAVFAALRARGKEPSTPKKIAIGMGIAASAYVLMAVGSMGVPTKEAITEMGGLPDAQRITPLLLIGTYFILTVAELFISPLGISFVSKVAPPKYQGMMQGLWLCATAIGNSLLFIGAILYENIPISMTWTVFIVACCISMGTMFFMLRWLERVSK